MHKQTRNPVSIFWRHLWGAEQKASLNREKEGKKRRETMDVGRSSAQGGDLGLNESVTLREITNEAREKAMDEWMEQIKKNGDSDNHLARAEKRTKRNSRGRDEKWRSYTGAR